MKTIDNAVLAGYNAGIERRGGRSVSLTIRTENRPLSFLFYSCDHLSLY